MFSSIASTLFGDLGLTVGDDDAFAVTENKGVEPVPDAIVTGNFNSLFTFGTQLQALIKSLDCNGAQSTVLVINGRDAFMAFSLSQHGII